MGTHALRMSILMGMASHLHLGFLVITFDASMIGCSLVEQIRAARVSVKGGHTGTCKDTFSKCLKVGDAIDEDDQRLIQGIIPDMVIDARGRINSGAYPDNPLDDRVSLFEHKTLASLKYRSRRAPTLSEVISKSAQRISTLVILALLLLKNSRPTENTLS